jgi:hypothetical protein
MKLEATREAVLHGRESPIEIYRSNVAVEYNFKNDHSAKRR